MFKDHHYLTGSHNNAARCYVAIWEDTVIGFASVITMQVVPLKTLGEAIGPVILPDFQGMGIGVRFTEIVANTFR
jgi:hypothetical protein